MIHCPNCAHEFEAAARRDLTPKELAAKTFIAAKIARRGMSPTHDEIARHMGCSLTRAFNLVSQLVRDGHIRKRHGRWRSLVVVEP
jgi:DNA-binding MarR family transcriptional regulator